MYKIDHPHDRSRLFYPDRKVLENISVTEIGTISSCDGYYKDITGGNFYIIQYLLSGKGVFRGQRFTAPCIFVVAPNDQLSYSVDSESESVEQFWIKLEGKETKSFLAEAGFPTVSSLCSFTYVKKAKQIFTNVEHNEINKGAVESPIALKAFPKKLASSINTKDKSKIK